MKTLIHIGQHKTGTTSIQHFLRDNRKVLTNGGLYVPAKIMGYGNPSHFILNVYALSRDRFSSMKERIIAKKGLPYIDKLEGALRDDIAQIYITASSMGCDKVIWSNEGLYLLNSVAEYRKLIDLFAAHSNEIEVVCCFRDVKTYRASYIKQLGKQNIAFSSSSDSYRYVELDSWLFNYQRKKRLLSKTFDRCTYFSYDHEDNIRQFMKAVGISLSIDTSTYRFNVTKPDQ